MPKKKRTYNTRLIKRDYSYTLQELSERLGTHKNTVRNWIKEGLPKIDAQRPFLLHGSDIISFLDERQAKRKHKCKDNEFYCFTCRAVRKAKHGSVDFIIMNKTQLNIRGQCEVCATTIHRMGSVKKREKYKRIFVNETLVREHIIDRTNPIYNCHLKKDENHDQKNTKIQCPERTYQTDLFPVPEGSRSESGQHN